MEGLDWWITCETFLTGLPLRWDEIVYERPEMHYLRRVERTPGKRRIVTLGDSYTFGDEVSDDETYSHYLGLLLPDAEVLNLGLHGGKPTGTK